MRVLPAAQPPELRLLLLCARTRLEADERAEAARILERDLDWVALVEAVLAHGIAPLLLRSLAELGSPPAPREIVEALRVHGEVNSRRAGVLADELCALHQDLARAGVEAISFKGPVLAVLAYGDPALRAAGDLDFLVRVEELEVVRRVLAARGYVDAHEHRTGRPLSRAQDAWVRRHQCQQLFVRPHDGLLVEPHWGLAPRTLAVDLELDALRARARERVVLAGHTLPTFALEDLLVVLSLHGSKHEWSELRWIADVAELLRRRPELDWSACSARASAQGCARMLRLGLLLAHGLLAAPLPAPVRESAERDRTAAALARLVARRLLGHTGVTSVIRLSGFRLRMRERARDRVRYALRTASTPSLPHLGLVDLPPALRFLYYPLKLAVDALTLPLRRRPRRARSAPQA